MPSSNGLDDVNQITLDVLRAHHEKFLEGLLPNLDAILAPLPSEVEEQIAETTVTEHNQPAPASWLETASWAFRAPEQPFGRFHFSGMPVVADPSVPYDKFYLMATGQNQWFDEQGLPTPQRAIEKPAPAPRPPVAPLKTRRAISLDETP